MSASMDKRLAEWLASGDTGTSSKAIMLWLAAGIKDAAWGASTPSDPADLGRCPRLLARVPEWKVAFPKMAEAGGLWPTFVRRWAEMENSFIAECGGALPAKGDRWSCPMTFALMRQVHEEAYASNKADCTETRFDGGALAGVSMRFKA